MPLTAFALAGLGGFNAHGAGFLAAATKSNVAPDLVTATSGQILVLADWLQGKDLEQALVLPGLEHNFMAQIAIALLGDPGIFRPALPEAIRRWLTPLPLGPNSIELFFNRLLPAQVYVPTRTPQDFETIARVFNSEAKIADREVGIVFNAYDLQTGRAVLFGNDKARTLWPRKKAIPRTRTEPEADGGLRQNTSNSDDSELTLLPITTEAVESALWLSLYGFDRLPQPNLIDGAYLRSCIVSELHTFDRIYVARPLAQGWLGKPPRNWFEVQDWQTEMWFSAGYKAEVDTLSQINSLVDGGKLKAPFKHVDLIEIAPETPAGYFNYFVERNKVFKRAYDQAIEVFRLAGQRKKPPAIRTRLDDTDHA